MPDRFPVGTKYVLESRGQLVQRYVELPDGRKIHLATRKALTCTCVDQQPVGIVPAQQPAAIKVRTVSRRSRVFA